MSLVYHRLMLKKIVVLLVAVATILVGQNYRNAHTEEGVHYHAGFRVYVDGVLQDYSDYKYMNFVPCSAHDEKKTPAEEQMEKAHLHDGVGDVAHVHRDGAKWRDLFTNIQVELPKDKQLKGYIDGVENQDIMDTPIKAYTTAIFVVGSDAASHEGELVSVDHIKEVESDSELCGASE